MVLLHARRLSRNVPAGFMSKYESVKHGELLPVEGGPANGTLMLVEKFLPAVFGEDTPPCSRAVDGVLYNIDFDRRVWKISGYELKEKQ